MRSALRVKTAPEAIKEAIYQASAYVGLGRTLDFLLAVNEEFSTAGVKAVAMGTTTRQNRFEKGLVAMGSAQPQLNAHAVGNLKMGNGREKLIAVVTALVPYVGYPKTLNAITAIEMATKN